MMLGDGVGLGRGKVDEQQENQVDEEGWSRCVWRNVLNPLKPLLPNFKITEKLSNEFVIHLL